MNPKRLVVALLLTGSTLTTGCGDSRNELLMPPERFSVVNRAVVTDVPERPLAKWARASDAELGKAVENAGGRVIIGIKEPGSSRGVYRGKVLASAATYQSAKEDLSEFGARIVHEYQLSPALVAKIDPSSVGVLRRLAWIDYLEPDLPGEWLSQDTTWNVQRVRADYAWTRSTGSGVDLLIIDSGIDNQHPDLDPESVQACDDSDGLDEYGHGTFVAGIATAVDNNIGVIGVAPGVDLWSSKVGTDSVMPSSVKCAIEYGRVNDFFVMSMSFEVDTLEALNDEIEAAWDEGHVLVAAAGNDMGIFSLSGVPSGRDCRHRHG